MIDKDDTKPNKIYNDSIEFVASIQALKPNYLPQFGANEKPD